jgi:YVTN family beta-propeller protein
MAADTVAGAAGFAEFSILGPLEASRSGRVLALGGPRQRAVLALLLVEANRVVSMDRLADDVWDGNPPEGWASTLQTYVFHLRRALEPDRAPGAAADVLVTMGRGYRLRVDRDHLDAARFQDGFTAGRAALEAGRAAEAAQVLREALGLWRGPALADLADYTFTRPEAARLEELRLAALEARIDADLALGRHDALTAELEQLTGEHPLRERLHGQLMLALYRCGRQADALAAYGRVRGLLAAELGIDPGQPLQQLHTTVLAHDPALDWHPGSQEPASAEDDRVGAGAPARSPRPGRSRRGPAVGRRELAWGRRHARRLLAIGSALAVAAAACIVVVARPWAGGPTALPANSVGLIDSAGGRVGAPVSVGSPEGLAVGDGSVWAVDSTDGTVSRINPATHAVVDQIPVGSAPTAVTVTGPDVWVTNGGDGTVSQIDAAASKVVRAIRVGNVPVAIAHGPSGVWVANQGDDTVDQINPTTGTVTRRGVPVGGRPDGIAVGPDAVWVANGEDGTVSRIDPATGNVGSPISVGAGPSGIAVTPTAVWVANSLDLTVSKIDPATARVTALIRVGDGPSAIVAAGNGMWVGDEFDATLDHIDPRTDRVDRDVSLGSSPQGIAVTGSGIWVAAGAFAAASHRGGTLTVVYELPYADPVQAYDPISPSALTTVYDGLVTLRRAGGVAGLTLVPDLALTLPHPTDGGTTYTFTLRRGIRYSNGTPVRASDFRRGIQRELRLGYASDYYEGILGARACSLHPRRCDLSPGIAVDDAAGTVTFHLSQADPDFLYKLALPLVVPTPPGVSPHRVINSPPFLPGTGPYMISQYRPLRQDRQPNASFTLVRNPYFRPLRHDRQPNASLTLVRNPYFHQWSYAAQPAGYPSVIRYKRVMDPAKRESAVIAGRADLTEIDRNGQSLATRYLARMHNALRLWNVYLSLNTRQPPFTNIKARQAVNYAIDRARVLQLSHLAPGQGATTCQILPAGFPAHHSYCPYTTGAKDGSWHGPDMQKARRLVKESGTTGTPVTLWIMKGFADRAVGLYLVGLLKDLGYRAKLRTAPLVPFFNAIHDSRNKVQVSLQAFGADFPAASTFYSRLLSCRSFYRDPTQTENSSGFCDHHVDKLASEAQARQPTDPAAARRLWARVDHIITDEAPWVPILDQALTFFASARLGNFQVSAEYGPLVDQMWVR